MVEVLIRTLLIYIFLLLVVRLMGQRMSGQISITELAVMITLGAIVSPAMQLPDRGILFAITVLGCALGFQRGLNYLEFKHEKVERATQGQVQCVIKDGQLNLPEMGNTGITKQQLYAMLRGQQITNLGKVKRGYLEACGILTVYKYDYTRAGLSLLPKFDEEIHPAQIKADDTQKACCNCGHVQYVKSDDTQCEICNSNDWSNSYLTF